MLGMLILIGCVASLTTIPFPSAPNSPRAEIPADMSVALSMASNGFVDRDVRTAVRPPLVPVPCSICDSVAGGMLAPEVSDALEKDRSRLAVVALPGATRFAATERAGVSTVKELTDALRKTADTAASTRENTCLTCAWASAGVDEV